MAVSHEVEALLASAPTTQTDLVAIADVEGRYVYANPATLEHTGWTEEELVGRLLLDLLHPDDLRITATGLSLLSHPIVGLSVNPAQVRLRRKDGTWLRLEINGSLVDASDGTPHVVFVARPTSDAALDEQLIRMLTGGASSAETFALVPEFGRWRQPALLSAVVHHDDDGNPAAAGSERLVALARQADLDDPAAPWSRCAASGEDLVAATHDLDPAFRPLAEAASIRHIRCRPVRDPLHGDAAVVVLGQATDAHGDTTDNVLVLMDYLFAKMTMVLDLALSWRQQVVELRRSALTDPLTGVANRTGFWAGFEHESARTSGGVGLLYVDLDRFKAVNDAYGHIVGDALLVAVADRLAAVVRPGDLIARMGGDEFTVILDGDADATTAIAERIVESLAQPFAIDGRTIEVGASVGVASTPAAAVTPQDLLDAADRALYRAKHDGRGRWCIEPLVGD